MAAVFQNVYHYNVVFSLLVGRVGGRFRRQLRPCRWKRIKFYGRYLFFFIYLCDSGFQRAFAWTTSREKIVDADCWLSWRNVDAEAAKQMKLSPSSPKNNKFSSRPIKPLARQEVQPPCFLLICTQTPAYWHPKLWIKWNGSFYFVSFVEKRCSSICPEKTTENSKRS